MKIKNIIFDLGGILLNIDYQKTIAAFERLGISNFNQQYSQFQQSDIFDRLETGKTTPSEFVAAIKQLLSEPNKVSDAEIIAAWNAMLLDFPTGNFDFLQGCRQNYRVFLLSNTNKIHYENYIKYVDNIYGRESFEAAFEKCYYSHEIGRRKPLKETYQWVLKDAGINAGETLFIEDTLPNIDGAKAVGIQTFHKTADKSWQDVVSAYGLNLPHFPQK